MSDPFDGAWFFKLLNGDPNVEASSYILRNELIMSSEAKEYIGTYEVVSGNLVLDISMNPSASSGPWFIRATLQAGGAVKNIMLGSAEAIFPECGPIMIADCSLIRAAEVIDV